MSIRCYGSGSWLENSRSRIWDPGWKIQIWDKAPGVKQAPDPRSQICDTDFFRKFLSELWRNGSNSVKCTENNTDQTKNFFIQRGSSTCTQNFSCFSLKLFHFRLGSLHDSYLHRKRFRLIKSKCCNFISSHPIIPVLWIWVP